MSSPDAAAHEVGRLVQAQRPSGSGGARATVAAIFEVFDEDQDQHLDSIEYRAMLTATGRWGKAQRYTTPFWRQTWSHICSNLGCEPTAGPVRAFWPKEARRPPLPYTRPPLPWVEVAAGSCCFGRISVTAWRLSCWTVSNLAATHHSNRHT